MFETNDADFISSPKFGGIKRGTLHCGGNYLCISRMRALVGLEDLHHKTSLRKQEAELPQGDNQHLLQCDATVRNHRPYAGQRRGETPCWLPRNLVPFAKCKQERIGRLQIFHQLYGTCLLDDNPLRCGPNPLRQSTVAY